MRISKIIVALLVSVVALTAMTGVAVANPAEVSIAADKFFIGGGVTDTSTVETSLIAYDVIASQTGSGTHTRYVTATTSDPNLWIRVYDATHTTGWSNDQDPSTTGHSFTYTAVPNNDYTFNVEVKGTVDGIVLVSDNWGNSYSGLAQDDADSDSRQALVPEFATIAIPAIAVLGLFLFFNKRKHKKD